MAQATFFLLICMTLGLASASLGSALAVAKSHRHYDVHGLISHSQGPVIEFGMKSISATENLIRSILKIIPGVKFIDYGIKTGLKILDTYRVIRDTYPGDLLALNKDVRERIQSWHAWTMNTAAKMHCRIMSRRRDYDASKCDTCLTPLPDHEAPTLHTMFRDIGKRVLGRLFPERLADAIERLRNIFKSNFIYLDGYVDCKDPAIGRMRRNCRDLRKESVAINVITIPISIAKWTANRFADVGEVLLTLTHGTIHRYFSIKDAYKVCLYSNPLY